MTLYSESIVTPRYQDFIDEYEQLCKEHGLVILGYENDIMIWDIKEDPVDIGSYFLKLRSGK